MGVFDRSFSEHVERGDGGEPGYQGENFMFQALLSVVCLGAMIHCRSCLWSRKRNMAVVHPDLVTHLTDVVLEGRTTVVTNSAAFHHGPPPFVVQSCFEMPSWLV